MAASLPRGNHLLAEKSGHWTMHDQPELVIRAIERVAARWREPRDESLEIALTSSNQTPPIAVGTEVCA